MPRRVVERLGDIEYLSVLDETGEVDRKLEPDIPEETLLAMHRAMLYARRFDERMLQLQRQGRIGTFAPIRGQEAAQIGTAIHLAERDWLVPSFRETGAQIMRGASPMDIWLFAAGYTEGVNIPDEARDLPLCVPVATQLLHAVGIAYACKYRREDAATMAFHGDGATSEGDFHEALNFGAVYELPLVFVCQNNQWAISVPRNKQTRSKTIAQKAVAYGLPGLQVDGNDPLAVWLAGKEAMDRARNESWPSLIECYTYRMDVHTTADDPTRYRSSDEVETWRKRDPIDRFQKYLKTKKLIDDDAIQALDKEITEDLRKTWEATEKRIAELSLTDPEMIFDYLYESLPPHLEDQRRYFQARMDKERGQ